MLKRRATFAALVLLLLTLAVAHPPVAAAQQPTPSTSAQEGFVPVQDLPSKEQLPAAPLVMIAYAVAWVAVLLYIWSVWQRLGRVEREMAEVSRRIEGARR